MITIQNSFRQLNEEFTVNAFKPDQRQPSRDNAIRFLSESKTKGNMSMNNLGLSRHLEPAIEMNPRGLKGTRNSSTAVISKNSNQSYKPGQGLYKSKENNVKLRTPILEKLNQLVIKKQLDEDRDPRNRMWKKDVLLTSTKQALDLIKIDPANDHTSKVAIEMSPAQQRIQKQFEESKQYRQRVLDRDNWICSYSNTEETYNQRMLERTH